LHSFVFIIVNV